MPALAGRIKRLEAAVHVLAGPCTQCGRSPGRWDENHPRRLSCTFDPPEVKHCPRCGAQTVYSLTFESPQEPPL